MSNGIKELATVDLNEIVSNKGEYHPSPVKWEDQVLYFLMLDRFSDNSERDYKDNENNIEYNGETPPYSLDQDGNALVNAEQWREAGNKWCGGNLKGLCSKIGYLKRLGITAIWISPVLKQVDIYNTYHGYGTQNFLDIDGNFGTKEDFIELVKEAHNNKIYVILDIILNHTGDVFEYKNGNRCYENDIQFPVENYRDANGDLLIPFSKNVSDEYFPEGAIWPKELQDPQTFSRKGEISDWNAYPETLNGDFPHPEGLYELRDIKLGEGSIECYSRSESLKYLCKIYSYWIAYTDIDGIRLDTVKHMDEGATRFFCSVIHEFAQSIGKENFYLISEDTDGRETAFKRLERTGLDAALGINDIPGIMEQVVKGYKNPSDYFDLFRHSLNHGKDSHSWFRDKVVTMFDDHDQVSKGSYKARFCAYDDGDKLIAAILALNLLSEGIPCIYYGSEQYFDGQGGNDRYIRECMFGGQFGAFRSKGYHFFCETHDLFKTVSKINEIRKNNIELRRGRQYLRQISGNGIEFGYPQRMNGRMKTIISWSRLFNNKEVVIAINTDPYESKTAWVTIDYDLHKTGDSLHILFSTDPARTAVDLVANKNGKAIKLTVPPAGVVILK